MTDKDEEFSDNEYDEENESDDNVEGNDTQWRCKRCFHDATTKGNLLSHLRRKIPCSSADNVDSVISIEDYIKELTTKIYVGKVYECQHCNSKFTTRQAKYKHKFSCKANKNEDSSANENIIISKVEIENLQATIKEHRTLIDYLLKELEMIKNNPDKPVINSISDEKRKYKKKKISHAVKISCWNTHVGELVPKIKCLCCDNVDITQHNFHCGHIVAERHGGTYEMSNLLPICNVCNNSMGTMNMNEFKSNHGFVKK